MHRLRLRYAAPDADVSLTARLRRGNEVVMERAITLPRTAGQSSWQWAEVVTPDLAAGRYALELVQPQGTPRLDVVVLAPQSRSSR